MRILNRSWGGGLAIMMAAAGCAGSGSSSVESTPESIADTSSALVGNCTASLDTFSPASPGTQGVPVTISGSGSCISGTVEYKLWGRAPGGSWTIFCNWQPGGSCQWDTTGLVDGNYSFQLWTRAQGSGQNYEGYSAVGSYVLGTWSLCTSATLAASASGPVVPGQVINLTSTATCDNNVAASYQFWVQPPGSPTWQIACDWSGAPGSCDYVAAASGEHHFQVWTRAATSQDRYEAYSAVVAFGGGSCTSATLSAAQGTGNIVDLTGDASCTTGTPEYKYWVEDTNSVWSIACDWTPGGCAWDTTGLPAGEYDIQVWTRAIGGNEAYQGYSNVLVWGGGDCPSVTLSAAAGQGSLVDLTATATCTTGSAEYRYWVRDESGNWSVACDWTQGACSWNTMGLPIGDYPVEVWSRPVGSHVLNQAYADATYRIGGVQAVVSGLNGPQAIALDASNIYFLEYGTLGAGYTDGKLSRVPLMGGAVTVLASNLDSPTDLAIDANNVYFVTWAANGGVHAVPKAGGSVTDLATAEPHPYFIAADANNVYWTNATQVMQVPNTGGAPTILASGLTFPSGIAVSGSDVFFADNGAATVNKVPVGGGSVTSLLSSAVAGAWSVRATATDVFFAANDSYVYSVPVGGGAPATINVGTASTPYFIGLDATQVYIGSYSSTGVAISASQSGGGVVLYPQMGAYGTGVAADSTFVYWATEGAHDGSGELVAGAGAIYRTFK